MNDQNDSTVNIIITLGGVLCMVTPVGFLLIIVFSWLSNTSVLLLFFFGGTMFIVFVCLIPCLGCTLYLSGNEMKKKRAVKTELCEKAPKEEDSK